VSLYGYTMTASKTPTIRTKVFKLSLTNSVNERLQLMADKYGLPFSTMAAFAIGEWLNTKESQFSVNAGIISGFKESFEQVLKAEMVSIPDNIKEEQLRLIKD